MDEMQLQSGHLFPIPVTLPVDPHSDITADHDVALHNAKNELVAVMTIEEVYEWERDEVAAKVLGTRDVRHPLVAEMSSWAHLNISGRLQVLQLPHHHDFGDLCHTHASLMLKQGLHPKIVSERLGHASIAITLDTYSHVLPGLQEAAALRFEEGLREPVLANERPAQQPA